MLNFSEDFSLRVLSLLQTRDHTLKSLGVLVHRIFLHGRIGTTVKRQRRLSSICVKVLIRRHSLFPPGTDFYPDPPQLLRLEDKSTLGCSASQTSIVFSIRFLTNLRFFAGCYASITGYWKTKKEKKLHKKTFTSKYPSMVYPTAPKSTFMHYKWKSPSTWACTLIRLVTVAAGDNVKDWHQSLSLASCYSLLIHPWSLYKTQCPCYAQIV